MPESRVHAETTDLLDTLGRPEIRARRVDRDKPE